MSIRVVFLDRDGTINVDRQYVSRVDDWTFHDGAVGAMRELAQRFALVVVTNQSGIARQYYTDADVQSLHKWVNQQLIAGGIGVAAWLYCPHAEEAICDCRKPKTGLARIAEHTLGQSIDYPTSWMIGDKLSDLGFGRALGLQTILLRSRYWTDSNIVNPPHAVFDSLLQATRYICSIDNRNNAKD